MWYELWDGDTGNRVGKYPTEEAALYALVEDIRLYGRDAQVIVSLGLLQRDPHHRQDRLIAEGTTLVERALALAGADSANGLAETTEPAERSSH
jgi:hypothetical protein